MHPYKMPLDYNIMGLSANGDNLKHVDPDGRVYISNEDDSTLDYIDNFDPLTRTTLHTFPAYVRMLNRAGDGNLLACCADAKIYRSTDNGATWVEVFDTGMVSKVSVFPVYNSISVYDKIVVIGNNSASNFNPDKNEIWLSRDYGETWEIMWECPFPIGHFHKVQYDPYEGLIWAVTGDSSARDMIYVSDDFGKTWQHLEHGDHIRATEIVPLPDHVLFLGDSRYQASVYRHKRPKQGTFQTALRPEKYWSIRKFVPDKGPNNWGTGAAVKYGENACAYFGFKGPADGNADFPASVYKTDGERFVPIWSQEKLPDADFRTNGIIGVWQPDGSDYVYAHLGSYGYSSDPTVYQNVLRVKINP